jgi:hypothetical protein
MIDMVVDAKFSFNDSAHARTSPKIGRVASFVRSTQQQRTQAAAIGYIEFDRPARSRSSFQGAFPALTISRFPAANGPAIDTQLPGDIYGGDAPLKQRDGAPTSLFEMLRASMGSHAQSIGLYLCRYQ